MLTISNQNRLIWSLWTLPSEKIVREWVRTPNNFLQRLSPTDWPIPSICSISWLYVHGEFSDLIGFRHSFSALKYIPASLEAFKLLDSKSTQHHSFGLRTQLLIRLHTRDMAAAM